jgi:hypothetical protein
MKALKREAKQAYIQCTKHSIFERIYKPQQASINPLKKQPSINTQRFVQQVLFLLFISIVDAVCNKLRWPSWSK